MKTITTDTPLDCLCLLGTASGLCTATVYGDMQELSTPDGPRFTYSTATFQFRDGARLSASAVAADPAAYLGYDGNVDALYDRALDSIQAWLDAALKRRASIPCPALGHAIVYDPDALTNATAIFMDGGCPAFICADNEVIALDSDGAQALKDALQTYRSGLYATARTARALLADARSNADVAAALDSLTL